MENVRTKTYSIGEAARLCGVTEKQLRNWEGKGHIPPPQRVICGKRSYRQFTEEGFKLIRRIKKDLEEGYTLSGAAKKARGGKQDGVFVVLSHILAMGSKKHDCP
jgi:DNA-binding transcriptional MerR regulator